MKDQRGNIKHPRFRYTRSSFDIKKHTWLEEGMDESDNCNFFLVPLLHEEGLLASIKHIYLKVAHCKVEDAKEKR